MTIQTKNKTKTNKNNFSSGLHPGAEILIPTTISGVPLRDRLLTVAAIKLVHMILYICTCGSHLPV